MKCIPKIILPMFKKTELENSNHSDFTNNLFFFSILLLLGSCYVSLILYSSLNTKIEINYVNRIAIMLLLLSGVFHFKAIVSYYLRRINYVDLILILFAISYLIGYNKDSMAGLANLARMIVCFYILGYYFSHIELKKIHIKIIVFIITIIVIWLLYKAFLLESYDDNNRFYILQNATSLSRLLFVMYSCIFSLLIFIKLNKFYKYFLIFQLLLTACLIIQTGCRIGLSAVICFPFCYYIFKSKKIFVFRNYVTCVLMLACIIIPNFVAYNYSDKFKRRDWGFLQDRGRISRYRIHFSTFLRHPFTGYEKFLEKEYFSSEDGLFKVNNLHIDKAAHNMFLNIAAKSGLWPALLMLFLVLIIIINGRILYRQSNHFLVSAFLTFQCLALVIAQLENYFTPCSTPMAYIFWGVGGYFCNELRGKKSINLKKPESYNEK